MSAERDASQYQAWEGFDGQEITYDEKKEKRHEASLWFYLMGAAVVILCVVLHHHISEIVTVHTGTCIEAEYSVLGNGNEVATYYDAEGKAHFFNISGMNAKLEGETVRLYYTDNIRDAITRVPWHERLFHYSFFGVIFGISLWRILKIYGRSSKSPEK